MLLRTRTSIVVALCALAAVALPSAASASDLDLDALGRRAEPSSQVRQAVAALGDVHATYNRFGTPGSLLAVRGALARDLPGADGAAKARAFVAARQDLFGLTPAQAGDLVVLHDRPLGDRGRAVLLRQRFGDLDAGAGLGQIAVALRDGDVVYASSTLAPTSATPQAPTLTAQQAFVRAAHAVGRSGVSLGDLRNLRSAGEFGTFDVAGLAGQGYTKLVALPLPDGTVHAAFQAIVNDTEKGQPLATTSFVDARTGEVLLRTNDVDNAADNPEWGAFPANPPLDSSAATDSRQRWCWNAATGCDRVVGPAGTPERSGEWDTLQNDPNGPATTTGTTVGNAARSEDASESNPLTPGATLNPAPIDPAGRSYRGANAPFANAWRINACNPAGFADPMYPDVAAAKVNLFVQHNRMHDFAYRLGFTEATYNLQVRNFGRGGVEGDPELGGVQAGADVGTVQTTVAGRDNANQITQDDGIPPITNMYLWQPLPGAFYANCVDGDFDMSVIGHEYTHAISNRMVAGPSAGLDTTEGGSMGESYSDLDALEYLHAYGFVPTGDENPWSVGAYVTGDHEAGIRNFPLDRNPLNYSDLGYDLPGVEVHSDGEVWNGANFELRDAYERRYDGQFPSSDRGLQERCADGTTPLAQCPGNRRWIQTIYSAFLLMQSDVSMVTARDAYLGADRALFGGANQDLLWDAFARRGLGEDAAVDPRNIDGSSNTDVSPKPSFSSPIATDDSIVTFAPNAPNAQLFVGRFQARATPVADTDPATPIGPDDAFRPGRYEFVARADGFGEQRFTLDIPAGKRLRLTLDMVPNVASRFAGATATGDAIQPSSSADPTAEPSDPNRLLANLIDDTEATNWAAVVSSGQSIAGKQVTVKLAGGEQLVTRVNVSAMLRAQDSQDPGGDTSAQNRYTGLRQFALERCSGTCSSSADFVRFYTSPADAFPGHKPRPRVSDLQLHAFDVPDVRATHLRLVVLTNQCTGGPDFKGDQDADPNQNSDCVAGSTRDNEVRAAELQAFGAPENAPQLVDTDAPAGQPGQAASTAPPAAPAFVAAPPSCSTSAGFRSAGVAARRRTLRVTFRRASRDTADVDVFQVARGRTVIGERLVARFADRSAAFTWNGKANRRRRRVTDGYYVVRFRTAEADGTGTDVRRVALRRSRGRFTMRPAFYGRSGCDNLRSAKLERPVFGGRSNRPLNIAFAVAAPARVTITIKRGAKTLRTVRRTVGAETVQRLRVRSERIGRGDVTVRIAATRGGRTVSRLLTARRL